MVLGTNGEWFILFNLETTDLVAISDVHFGIPNAVCQIVLRSVTIKENSKTVAWIKLFLLHKTLCSKQSGASIIMTQYHCACFPLSRSPQHVGWLLILLRHVLNCLGGTKKWSRRWGVSSSRFSFLKVTFLKFLYKTSMYISLART